MPIPARNVFLAGLSLALAVEAWPEKQPPLPKIRGKEAVASVNGDPITLDEYLQELGAVHARTEDVGQVVPERDPAELLNRLVNLRLMLQEAKNIGLDELPEFQAAMRAEAKETLRAAVLDRVARDVPPPTAAEIEPLYRDKVMEFRVASVMFRTKDEAARFVESLSRGSDFLETGKRWAAEGKALSFEEPTFLKRSQMLPDAVKVLDALPVGKLAPQVPVGDGFAVILLLERRVPDDPAIRQGVEEVASGAKRAAALRDFADKLRGRLVKVNEAVVQGLDFDADPKGFDKLLGDDRVVAQIRGADPIRVRDLAATLKARFFHGIERAGEKKRLNRAKANTLEELVTEAAIQQEGKDLKLDRTPEYQAALEQARRESLFGLFLRRAVEPSIRIQDDDVKSYYERNIARFTSPEMIRVDSLALVDAGAGQHAVDRLKAGADLLWMRANAEGRIDLQDVPEELRFDGRLVTLDSLPSEVRKALEGATTGDFRLFVESSGRSHALAVRERTPAGPMPLDQVRTEVGRRVFEEKRNQAVDDWAAKLRGASKVEVFATSEQLRRLAMERAWAAPSRS